MTKKTGVSEEDIREAARLVLAGRIIAYPTDTVYGLGCNPFDPEAVERLVQAKQRVKGGLPLLVSSFREAKRLGEFVATAERLAEKFWPGPLTLIVKPRVKLPLKITGESSSVGLRVPNHGTARKLIEICGGVIVGTSANVSGHPSARSADEAIANLGGRIDLVLDGGPAPLGRESTVVRVVGNSVTVVREGAISRDDILKIAMKSDAS